MTISPKAAGAVQVLDSLLATLDLGPCAAAGHAYLVVVLLFLSLGSVVMGAWNLATR